MRENRMKTGFAGCSKPTAHNCVIRKETIMQKILFTDKTRWQHFGWAIPIGAVFTILCVLGVASGMEFKDHQWGGKADWKDWVCTMLGGLVGQAIQFVVVWLILIS